MITLMIFMFFSLSDVHAQDPIRFSSDGCTLSPDGTMREPEKWKECCVAHDLSLWGGGTKSERKLADLALKSCLEVKANKLIAQIYWIGVRLGNLSPWKIPTKRWGNAWGENAGYRNLSHDEIELLIRELDHIDIAIELKDSYRSDLLNRL
jgi:hypothetical protein